MLAVYNEESGTLQLQVILNCALVYVTVVINWPKTRAIPPSYSPLEDKSSVEFKALPVSSLGSDGDRSSNT